MKLLIVDDHFMVIEGVRTMLQQEPYVEWIEYASNADSCLSFLRHKTPDVLLMDINLPGRSGIELCKEVKESYPLIQIIALSTFSQSSYVRQMIENGASGYLLKNASKEEITEAIETVLKGDKYLSMEAALAMRKKETALPLLTRREKEILTLIAEGHTNVYIAQQLFLSINTIDTHRKNLMAKLQVKNTAALIRLAFLHRLIDIADVE